MWNDEDIHRVDREHERDEKIREPSQLSKDRISPHPRSYVRRGADPPLAVKVLVIPKTTSSRIAFEGRVFRVRIDEVLYDDGSTHHFDVVEHPGSFGIIALSAPNEIVLVRQYRHPVRRYLWEIPAGTAEHGEDPALGAARELAEETGYRAERIRPLGTTFMTPGFCDEVMRFFVAEGLSAGGQALDDDERIEVGRFAKERAWELVRSGEIADVKTLLALRWMAGERGELVPGTVDRVD